MISALWGCMVACACLISQDLTLTDEERSFLEYYMEELSREFFSGKPTIRLTGRESSDIESVEGHGEVFKQSA